MQRMGQTSKGHVECSVPGDDLLIGGSSDHPGDVSDLGFRAFSHIGRLVELPDLGLGDLVGGVRGDGVGHILVGLVVADVLVGELILEDAVHGLEGVDGAFSLGIHDHREDHYPGSSVEATDWEFSEEEVADSPSEDALLDVPVPVDGMVSLAGEIFVDVIGGVMGAEEVVDLSEKEGTCSISCWALELRVRKFSFFCLANMRV